MIISYLTVQSEKKKALEKINLANLTCSTHDEIYEEIISASKISKAVNDDVGLLMPSYALQTHITRPTELQRRFPVVSSFGSHVKTAPKRGPRTITFSAPHRNMPSSYNNSNTSSSVKTNRTIGYAQAAEVDLRTEQDEEYAATLVKEQVLLQVIQLGLPGD